MLPFCGYNMGDYFGHWISCGSKSKQLPRIYYVNWFRKDPDGHYLWPGFGENSRVLKWIFERTSNDAPAYQTPIGLLPTPHALDLANLHLPSSSLRELLSVDKTAWLAECDELTSYFQRFDSSLPKLLFDELANLKMRLLSSRE